MTLEYINPDDLPIPTTYTQVVVARGSRLVFVAGQEPENVDGKLVGPGDLAAQARQVFANLGRALAAEFRSFAVATCKPLSTRVPYGKMAGLRT